MLKESLTLYRDRERLLIPARPRYSIHNIVLKNPYPPAPNLCNNPSMTDTPEEYDDDPGTPLYPVITIQSDYPEEVQTDKAVQLDLRIHNFLIVKLLAAFNSTSKTGELIGLSREIQMLTKTRRQMMLMDDKKPAPLANIKPGDDW